MDGSETSAYVTKEMVRKMDPVSLSGYLCLQSINEPTIHILVDQDVSGKSFFDLTQQDFLAMGIKMGPAKELLQIINNFQQSNDNTSCLGESFSESEIATTSNKRKSSNSSLSEQSNPDGSSSKILKCLKGPLHNDSQSSSETSFPQTKAINKTQFTRYATIRKTLANHKQGSNILKALDGVVFTEKERRQLVKIIVAELVQVQTAYPPHEAKMAMCETLIKEFPRLRNEDAAFGYEHFYDPKTKLGFVHYKLQEHQKNLPKDQKKYSKKISSSKNVCSENNCSLTLLEEEELNEKISLMKHKNPSPENKRKISEYMSETFYNRRNWILQNHPTVSEVMELYPRLANYDGDIIDEEFDRMHKKKGDSFITIFPTEYMTKIVRYAGFAKPELLKKYIHEKDDYMKALLISIDLLPVPNSVLHQKSKNSSLAEENVQVECKEKGLNKGKGKSKDIISAQNCFLQKSTDGTDVETYINKQKIQIK